jgi:type 2 lantibiotic biosynthesis protein LanM
MPEVAERAVRAVAQRAATLAERLEQASALPAHDDDPALVQRRLEQWCQAVAKGDWDTFRKRLACDGLDLDAARRALSPPRWPDAAPLPAWADLLQEALRLATDSEDAAADDLAAGDRFLDAAQPLPFEELLAPFVRLARRCLAARAGAVYDQLADVAHATLERALLAVLAGYAARALYLEFSLQRTQQQSGLQWLLARPVDGDERALHRQFVCQMLQGGLLAFFEEYPVLARLVGTATHLWVEAHLELLQRLAADWPALQRTFGGDGALGQVMAAQPSLSDPHRGRRSVVALTFASGRQVVYKPKDLGTEEAYHRLLAWLNARGAPLPFRVVEVLNRTTHGWVEFVEHLPCGDQEEARRYYRRAGMLLCLVYALEGTDCHGENLIASGEHPVLVDLETLLHHRAREEDQGDGAAASLLAYEQLNHSVLRTGLLPSWEVRADGRVAVDVSGLGADAEQETAFRAPRWRAINTDRMALEPVPSVLRPGPSVPRLDGVPLRLDAYGDDVLTGFRQMYRFLVDQREALLAPDSPLQALARQRVRFLHRPTRVYGLLQHKLLDPAFLRDGVDRGIQLDVLARALLPFAERSRWWPIVAAERQALEQTDIPIFTAPASSDALEVAPGEVLAGCFTEPSSELMLARLRALGDEDLARQVPFIEGTLYAHVARDGVDLPPEATVATSATPAEALAGDALVARAVAIADELRARAIHAADGSVAWIAPQYLPRAERFQFQPLGEDLYGGACGIALFLAALEAATGGAEYRALALGALRPLRWALREHRERLAGTLGIGGASGLGGVVYALVRTGQLLHEPALLADAERAAALITAERIAADRTLDVIAGAAGAVLGLCALSEAGGDRQVLERAVACGQHLLRQRAASEAGSRTWATLDGKLLTGFSHGAAGIAYALLRLFALTGAQELLDAASEAIAYERGVFSAEAGNWPDFRGNNEPAYPSQWCHGAAGIGLARLGGLPALDTDEIRRDIAVAVETTCQLGLRSLDHLCCGNLGRVDILLAAAQRLDRPDLRELASRRATAIVQRAEQAGAYALHPLLPRSAYDPSFFQGTAGIGYALLRVAYADRLPCVLLWE